MVVFNDLDRCDLVIDVIDRVPKLGAKAAYVQRWMREKLIGHQQYIPIHGSDLPEVHDWTWPG